MSVPPEIMQRMMQARQQEAGEMGQVGPAPTPMMQPQASEGDKSLAFVRMHIAQKMVESCLPLFGIESKEGKLCVNLLNSMIKHFGKDDNSDLVPAEVAQQVRSLSQNGGGAQMQQALAAAGQQAPQPQAQPMSAGG